MLNQLDKVRIFLQSLVSKLTIGINDFQVAAITFDFYSKVWFSFNEFYGLLNPKSHILEALGKIKGNNGSTYTTSALNLGEQVCIIVNYYCPRVSLFQTPFHDYQ